LAYPVVLIELKSVSLARDSFASKSGLPLEHVLNVVTRKITSVKCFDFTCKVKHGLICCIQLLIHPLIS